MNTRKRKQYRVSHVAFQRKGEPYKLFPWDSVYHINGVMTWRYAGENYELNATFAIDKYNCVHAFFSTARSDYRPVTYQLKNLCLL
jgi:N-acetyl-anhydromuramyl-L-alanine amidase AmpD